MKFTRRQVLEAIRREPLKGDSGWVSEIGQNGNCKVCAVGGLLRRTGICLDMIPKIAEKITGAYDTPDGIFNASYTGNLELALHRKNYLLALSIQFERLARRNHGAGPKTRDQLARFVKRHFPKEFNTVVE